MASLLTKSEKYPCVFIVLVNFKSWQDTVECLESVFQLTYHNFSVVVIDNDSQNNSIDYLKKWAEGIVYISVKEEFYTKTSIELLCTEKPVPYLHFIHDNLNQLPLTDKKLIFIESKANLGFAGGNNIGIKTALANQAAYIWLLNNDTVVTKESLTDLLKHFKKAKDAGQRLGMLGAKLLYYHNPELVQAVLGRYKPITASTEHIGLNQAAGTAFEPLTIAENDYIVGASMCVSAEFAQEVGPMSEEYFLYFEEIDWVKRGREKNYSIDVCLDAVIYHKEGASIGGGLKDNNNKSKLSDFYSIRNRLIITNKFYKKYLLSVYLSLIFVAANRIRRKQFDRIPLIFKAIQSSFKRPT